MVIIDFSKTSKQAFINGFSKGLAAPVMLFGSFDAPPLVEIKQIYAQPISDENALQSDWYKIGTDINNVISRYDSKVSTEK